MKKMEKLKEKDGSEIHPGTERQGIGFHFFLCRYEALKIVASTMDSACWAVHMKNGDQTKKSLWP
jgi:hypothetical protein